LGRSTDEEKSQMTDVVPRRATEFFQFTDGKPDESGLFISHYADPYTQITRCGEQVKYYSDGWMWGSPNREVTCARCNDPEPI
jgi:hypothetical protein